jgi:death-on-curing protein
MSDPVFLTIEQIKILHRLALERHGGQDGVRDPATLESATMHPCHVWLYGQRDLFDIPAAYAFHLDEAQAFVDGNKRTGMGAALVFLEGNGFRSVRLRNRVGTPSFANRDPLRKLTFEVRRDDIFDLTGDG